MHLYSWDSQTYVQVYDSLRLYRQRPTLFCSRPTWLLPPFPLLIQMRTLSFVVFLLSVLRKRPAAGWGGKKWCKREKKLPTQLTNVGNGGRGGGDSEYGYMAGSAEVFRAGIFKQSMGARNRVEYDRTGRWLHRLAKVNSGSVHTAWSNCVST